MNQAQAEALFRYLEELVQRMSRLVVVHGLDLEGGIVAASEFIVEVGGREYRVRPSRTLHRCGPIDVKMVRLWRIKTPKHPELWSAGMLIQLRGNIKYDLVVYGSLHEPIPLPRARLQVGLRAILLVFLFGVLSTAAMFTLPDLLAALF